MTTQPNAQNHLVIDDAPKSVLPAFTFGEPAELWDLQTGNALGEFGSSRGAPRSVTD